MFDMLIRYKRCGPDPCTFPSLPDVYVNKLITRARLASDGVSKEKGVLKLILDPIHY